jgi:hypothetical protein
MKQIVSKTRTCVVDVRGTRKHEGRAGHTPRIVALRNSSCRSERGFDCNCMFTISFQRQIRRYVAPALHV